MYNIQTYINQTFDAIENELKEKEYITYIKLMSNLQNDTYKNITLFYDAVKILIKTYQLDDEDLNKIYLNCYYNMLIDFMGLINLNYNNNYMITKLKDNIIRYGNIKNINTNIFKTFMVNKNEYYLNLSGIIREHYLNYMYVENVYNAIYSPNISRLDLLDGIDDKYILDFKANIDDITKKYNTVYRFKLIKIYIEIAKKLYEVFEGDLIINLFDVNDFIFLDYIKKEFDNSNITYYKPNNTINLFLLNLKTEHQPNDITKMHLFKNKYLSDDFQNPIDLSFLIEILNFKNRVSEDDINSFIDTFNTRD